MTTSSVSRSEKEYEITERQKRVAAGLVFCCRIRPSTEELAEQLGRREAADTKPARSAAQCQ